jgi:osmotically-inducible protein OsmY
MRKCLSLVFAAVLGFGSTGLAFGANLPAENARLEQRLNGEVRHELAMIPQVTVFDNLGYRVEGSTVTLYGQVRDAIIADSAEKRVKRLEGVERVDNKIEVLPASFNDDRIRVRVARAVFGDSRLFYYGNEPVAPIRIIVKNGRVDLEGVVRTPVDKDTAFIRANGVPGVFQVENHLQVELPKKG